MFLEAIDLFGNNWNAVEKYVQTRSQQQLKTHALKYLGTLDLQPK